MFKTALLSLVILATVVACNKESKSESAEYKYSYTCNGCPTDEQVFTTKEDYCSGLLDESRNKSCCRNMREQTYNNECK